jgi:micrococcal nuclease
MRGLPFLLLASACSGLDRVPIVDDDDVQGCAPGRDEEVACTLDGDTFHVGDCGGESIRMLGVDAPEIAHNDSEVAQCWGDEAAAWLDDYLTGEDVRLTFDEKCTDAYDRTLAYVWIYEGEEAILVNEEIIRAGYARFYEEFDVRLEARFQSAQDAAQADDLGLWAECE